MCFYASKCNGICNWHKAGTAIFTYLIKWQVAFVDNVKTLTSGKLPCHISITTEFDQQQPSAMLVFGDNIIFSP